MIATISKNRTRQTKVEPALTGNGDRKISVAPTKLKIENLRLTIGGPRLVCHRWEEKSKRQIEEKQQLRKKSKPEQRDPFGDFEQSLYRFPTQKWKFGIPAIALKKAGVSAGNDVGLVKTELRRAFHVLGDLVEITAEPIKEPQTDADVIYEGELQQYWQHGISMRRDVVRIPSGSDLRYRGQFLNWKITFELEFNAALISPEQIVALMTAAGFGAGLCEGRPEKDGEWGRFEVLFE